jgi:hypothetical protein
MIDSGDPSSVSLYSFLHPEVCFSSPKSFNFEEYIETERELWAFFPETFGKRVNFCQIGLTAKVYVEVQEDGSDLESEETYFLMPCPEGNIRPVRMKAMRRLTLDEFRLTHLTALKLGEELSKARNVFDSVDARVLGAQ